MVEQVQVEREIKKRSGQGRGRAPGALGLVKCDKKPAAQFAGGVSSVRNLRLLTSLRFRYQNGRKLGLNIFLLSPPPPKKRMLSGRLLPFFIFLTL